MSLTKATYSMINGAPANVLDFGAVGNGVANDSAAIQAALNAMGALTTGGEVYVPAGTYACASTLTIPAKVTLRMSGARIVSSAVDAIVIALGNGAVSGRIIGAGQNSVIEHTGTGHAIRLNGAGESAANALIADIRIIGSATGQGGVFATNFNGLYTRNMMVIGYTAGNAVWHYGVNAVTHWSPILIGCLNGVINSSINIGATVQQANAIRVYGGSIVSMPGWGWIEQIAAGGTVPNLSNVCDGVVFENNGVNGSAVTGHMYLENTVKMSVINCYFEDTPGQVPVSAILIGDATNSGQAITISGNMFATTGTNVINNVNGQTVIITGNYAGGAVTNFVNQGTLTRGAVIRSNRAPAATNVWAGTDGGLETNIDVGTLTNANGTSSFGYSFNSISGLAQDLEVRTRSGGANVMVFVNAAGTSVGAVSDTGFVAGAGFSVGGDQVVGARSTGWSAMSGTATKGGFNTATVTTAQLAQVVKALTDALTTSGAIGA